MRDIYVALCAGKNASVLVMAVPWVKFTTYQLLKTQQSSSPLTRKLSAVDKEDLRREERCHGFSQSLINDIVNHAEYIFSGKYLTENLAIYSTIHAIDVLEIIQELFGDIADFQSEMDELHLLRKHFNEIECYLVSNSNSGDTAHAIVEELPVAVAHYDLDF